MGQQFAKLTQTQNIPSVSTLLKWSLRAKMYEHQCPGDHSDCALWGSCPQLSPCCMRGELSRKAGCENVNSQSAGDMDIRASQNQAFSALSLVGRGTHRHRLLDAWGLVGAGGGDTAATPRWAHCAGLPGLFFWVTLCPTEGQGDRMENHYVDRPSFFPGCC